MDRQSSVASNLSRRGRACSRAWLAESVVSDGVVGVIHNVVVPERGTRRDALALVREVASHRRLGGCVALQRVRC